MLIVNTYHEPSAPGTILDAVVAAMKPGARLVIVDRRARTTVTSRRVADRHEVALEVVDREIRLQRFDAIHREDQFIERPEDDDTWWMIVA